MRAERQTRDFHITIGAGVEPTPKGVSLEGDLRLVKGALLYADRTKLCSLSTSLVLMFLAMSQQIGQSSREEQLALLERLIPSMNYDWQEAFTLLSGLELYRQLRRKKHRNTKELIFVGRFENLLGKAWTEAQGVLERLAEDAGAAGIIQAMQSELLEVHVFGQPVESGDFVDEAVKEYFDLVSNSISDGTTFPLFDDQTGALISAGLREGKVSVSDVGVARAKHIGLAADLLARLPLFDGATVVEILDIRADLERPLVRFRGAMMGFSETIKTAPWDKDFPLEADAVFRRDIAPAILEIEEAVESNSYLKTLMRKAIDKPLVLPGGSVLAVAVSQLSSLPQIVSQALAIGGAAGLIAYDAYKEWQEKEAEVERNQMFFYYEAGERLKELK